MPLHHAAQGDHTDVVKFLVGRSGNVTAKTSYWNSLLHLTSCLELVMFLVEQGADLHARNCINRTPLHVAAGRGQLDTVNYLLNQGADINSRDQCGFSALTVAIEGCHAAIAEALIERGCDLSLTNEQDPEGADILALNARKGLANVIKLLLAKGFSVDTIGKEGKTPLMVAAGAENYETVEFLLDHGADINATAHIVKRKSYDSDSKEEGEDGAIRTKQIRVVTPLVCALGTEHNDVAELLMKRGAETTSPAQLAGDDNIHLKNAEQGQGLLISAICRENLDFARFLLLRKGVDVNGRDSSGNTALCCALQFMKRPQLIMEMCKFLIAFGADINMKGIGSNSPLLIATELNIDNLAELLLELGCETQVGNDNSLSPVHLRETTMENLLKCCFSAVLGPMIIRMIKG